MSQKENHPIPGQTRFTLYQPVKFTVQTEHVSEEKIGIVAICDAYGTFFAPDEPSYDIYAMYQDRTCLFKHYPESEVQALTEEEIRANQELLSALEVRWKKK